MAKPLHAGKASVNGLLAARLARGGFTGNPALLEAEHGFGVAAGGRQPNPAHLDQLAERWCIRDTLFKFHAACYLSHSAINATLSIADKVPVANIDRLEVHVADGPLQVCNIAAPSTGLEGKFSLRAATAMALLGHDTTNPASFTDQLMADPQLVAVRDKVQVVKADDLAPTQARVIAVGSDARRFQATDDTGVPLQDLAIQGARLGDKFVGLASPVIGEQAAHQLLDAVNSLAPAETISKLAAA
jgi:2-methylcitrate dehydratase PrpD